MTFLASFTTPQAGLIAADTLAYRGDGAHAGSMSKVYTIAHANMVLAGSGTHAVLAYVLGQSWRIHSIDTAAAEMPRILEEFGRSQPAAAARDSIGMQAGSDVYLVGYSPERRRMVSLCWSIREGFTKVRQFDHSDDLVLSHAPAGELQPFEDEQGFVDLARRAFIDAAARGALVGGNLLLVKVDASGLSVRCIKNAEAQQ